MVFPLGITATGGVISDYVDPGGTVYRAHVFTSSGTFDCNCYLVLLHSDIDYLVVGGGGAGGGNPTVAAAEVVVLAV